MVAVADTGFIVAYINQSDRYHQACINIHRQQDTIYLPQTVLAEVAYFVTKLGGNRSMSYFLQNMTRSHFELISLTQVDIERIVELLNKYADTRLDFVDVSVAVIAERLSLSTILTIDYRDFTILRPKHVEYFELLPHEQ